MSTKPLVVNENFEIVEPTTLKLNTSIVPYCARYALKVTTFALDIIRHDFILIYLGIVLYKTKPTSLIEFILYMTPLYLVRYVQQILRNLSLIIHVIYLHYSYLIPYVNPVFIFDLTIYVFNLRCILRGSYMNTRKPTKPLFTSLIPYTFYVTSLGYSYIPSQFDKPMCVDTVVSM